MPPQLSPAQTELLAFLSEESGEVVQAIGKVLRHGYAAGDPYRQNASNREDLEREIGNLQAAVELLVASGELDAKRIRGHKEKKLRTVGAWLYFNKNLATRLLAALFGGLVLGCAVPETGRLIRHADGTFEDRVDGRCFRYVALGSYADLIEVPCP